MNIRELKQHQKDHGDAVLDDFIAGGSRSAEVTASVRAKAEAAVKAQQAEAHEAAVAAEIRKLTSPREAAGDEQDSGA